MAQSECNINDKHFLPLQIYFFLLITFVFISHYDKIASSLYITLDTRESVVDFTQPYFLESTTLVSRAPEEKARSLAVFYPFTPRVSIQNISQTTEKKLKLWNVV